MLWKYEPVVLAVLALGAAILMENHHRVDMTRADAAEPPLRTVLSTCQTSPKGPYFGVTSAAAAEGEATLIVLGNSEDVADACAASYRNYSAAASGVDSVVP